MADRDPPATGGPLELLFFPFAVLIALPFLPLAPALVFGAVLAVWRNSKRGRVGTLIAAVAWLAYGIYETRMWYWSQTVIAPIRVDLLLIAPLMYGMTALGIWSAIRMKRSRASSTI